MIGAGRAMRFTGIGLVVALLGAVLPVAAAVGEPAQFESAFAAGGGAVVVGVESPAADGGELGSGDGLAPGDDGEFGLGDGLAPGDGLGGPELGEAVHELGVLDLVGPDGVWVMQDGGRGVPLRLLDGSEVVELGDARSLAASSAASAYAPWCRAGAGVAAGRVAERVLGEDGV